MEKMKCYQCGLVNWSGTAQCARCTADLTRSAPVGRNPFEGRPPSKFSGFRLGALLFVVFVGGFIAYYAFSSDPPKNELKVATQSEVDQQKRMAEIMADAQKKDAERMEALRKSWQTPAPGLTDKQKFGTADFKKTLQQHCSNGTHFGPGGTPPGCTSDGRVITPSN